AITPDATSAAARMIPSSLWPTASSCSTARDGGSTSWPQSAEYRWQICDCRLLNAPFSNLQSKINSRFFHLPGNSRPISRVQQEHRAHARFARRPVHGRLPDNQVNEIIGWPGAFIGARVGRQRHGLAAPVMPPQLQPGAFAIEQEHSLGTGNAQIKLK